MTHIRTIARLIGGSLFVLGTFMTAVAPSAGGEAHRRTIAVVDSKPAVADETAGQIEPPRPVEVIVSGGTAEHRHTALWAIQRFEAAGLAVPPIELHLHQDTAECKGNRGIYNSDAQRIDVCVDEPAVVLHEIAHAWNHENLSDSQRSEYVSAGGFGSWDDPETPWSEKGSEDAADTISWALLEESIAAITPDGPIAQRDAAYLLLTGSHAPRLQMNSREAPAPAGASR